ncbi:acyltransferase family protein [Phocaeicola dorei]|uniref:acyltransferase family protein n=2 Tax=Bacteroidaceae TaxID=815 RepID=UPI0034A0EF7C
MNGLVRWGKRHSPSISCIRLVAMLLIISCHICQYYGNELAWWLNVGVQIFFVLSGFLYGNKRIDEPIEWIRKQFVKILPTYYLFIFITVILYLIFSPETLSITSNPQLSP